MTGVSVAVELNDDARPASTATTASSASTATRRRTLWPEIAIGVILAACVVVAHPVAEMLRRPYWIDEAWVADLTRVSWSTAAARSSSTPLGWLALLRLVPGGGLQRGRELTLAFSIGTVLMAYALVRTFRWPNRFVARVAAITVALVVAWVPLSLARNDLKQYTADAFLAVSLLFIGRVVERRAETRRRPFAVGWLGLAVLLAIPFSTVAAFVGAALFVAFFVVAVADRDRARVLVLLIAGAVMAVVGGLFFAAFVLPGDTKILRHFWNPMYLGGSPSNVAQEAWSNLTHLSQALAMPAIVAVALFALGIVALLRRRERVIAVTMLVLWAEMFALGIARRYPFLDQRTSHFLLVPTVLVIAFGVVDALLGVAKRRPLLAFGGAITCAVLFGAGVVPFWRQLGIANEDTRTPTQYVAANMRPGDVTVVDVTSNFGFAYYWPNGDVRLISGDQLYNGFVARVGNARDVVYASGRGETDFRAALREALSLEDAFQEGGRIFVVRSHMKPSDREHWDRAFAELGLHPRAVAGGPDPLLEIDR
jgi:hypothetical protein